MIITISGEPGAGSTTVSQIVADKLRFKLVTVGEINKQIAEQQGLTIEKFWEKIRKDPEEEKRFHNELDRKQKELASAGENIVFNAKLGAFQIPDAKLKVLLTCSIEERARRTVERDGGSIEEAATSIKNREDIERQDWKKIYGFDYVADKEYYDMLIDTTEISAEEIAQKIIKYLEGI